MDWILEKGLKSTSCDILTHIFVLAVVKPAVPTQKRWWIIHLFTISVLMEIFKDPHIKTDIKLNLAYHALMPCWLPMILAQLTDKEMSLLCSSGRRRGEKLGSKWFVAAGLPFVKSAFSCQILFL